MVRILEVELRNSFNTGMTHRKLVKKAEDYLNNVNKATRPPQKIYIPPDCTDMGIMDTEPDYMVQCPKCVKRIIDVYEMPVCMVRLRYKCPHCKSVIIMPLAPVLGSE